MKIGIPATVLLFFALHVPGVQADTYYSDLGYSITLPDGWSVLKKEGTRDKPEIVNAALEAARDGEGLPAVPAEIASQTRELLLGGDIDYYYSPDPQFNISVYRGIAEIPQSPEEMNELRKSMPEQLSKQMGRQVNVDQCEPRTVGGRSALYLVADDYRKGRKYIQYQIQSAKAEVLFFTASSNKRDFKGMKEGFEHVMDSLQLKPVSKQ